MKTSKMAAVLLRDARRIYGAGVEAVGPRRLIRRAVDFSAGDRRLRIGQSTLELRHNCRVVGFGKAVVDMALGLEELLGDHIVDGILSAPVSTCQEPTDTALPAKYRVYRGAADNLPDADSVRATAAIEERAVALGDADVLLVLVSGGGSALLADPIDGLTLQDKLEAIRLVVAAGASIDELNAVRKRLSRVKGGRLAEMARPAAVVALILSDVIGDRLDVIASGPTVVEEDQRRAQLAARRVVERYALHQKLPAAVVDLLDKCPPTTTTGRGHDQRVSHHIIGNIGTALEAAGRCAEQLGFHCRVLGSRVRGEAADVGAVFARLADLVGRLMAAESGDGRTQDALEELLRRLDADRGLTAARLAADVAGRRRVCLVAGGETTVTLRGAGRGGRNQELALAWAVHSARDPSTTRGAEMAFLSAGTDGIDGPTDAAGALATPHLVARALQLGLDPAEYLERNDSYGFFSRLDNGSHHLIVGPTGTNVMDIFVLCVTLPDPVPA